MLTPFLRASFDVRPTFNVQRSTFDVRRSAFGVRRSAFDSSFRGSPLTLPSPLRGEGYNNGIRVDRSPLVL